MTEQLDGLVPAVTEKAARRAQPSAARSRGLRRARAVQEARRGNANALKFGVFAEVANAEDVTREVALTYAARPGLDPIADRRLVELLATSTVQRSRALLAMRGTEGLTGVLTSYDARLAPLVERLERQVHQREQERVPLARKAQPAYTTGQYAPRARQDAT